jgi:hypothetical protein
VSSSDSNGPVRRLLSYFGLVNSADDRFATRPNAAASRPEEPATMTEGSRNGGAVNRIGRTVAVYFGLAEDEAGETRPGRSRYGNVSPALDAELSALRGRVDALEARVREIDADPDRGGEAV